MTDAALTILFRDMRGPAALRAKIEQYFAKLARFHDRITSCAVVVQAPHRSRRKGRLYGVTISLKLPGRDIVVDREAAENHAHEDLEVAIHDAFDAVTRRLEDTVRRRRGEVKTHPAAPEKRITSLKPPPGERGARAG